MVCFGAKTKKHRLNSCYSMASNITSKQAFVHRFPNVKLDRSVTDPAISSGLKNAGLLEHNILVDWLSGDLGSQLRLVKSIIESLGTIITDPFSYTKC